MATDDLIDDNAPAGGDAKSAAPAIDPAVISSAVSEGLKGFSGDMRTFASSIAQSVQQVVGQAQNAQERGRATPDQADLTQQLLSEPEKAITGIVEKIMQAQLGPYLATQVNDTYDTHVEKHRSRIDSQYGEGTFDEIIAPELDAIVEKTPNKAAKASKEYVATVIRGIVGHENILPQLNDKRSAKAEADKKREADLDAPNGILDGGRRRAAKPGLSADDQAYLAGYEANRGVQVDRKLLEEAINVRKRDGGWNEDNFPGLKKTA